MFISVIICTYNRDKYIYNVLKSLADNTLPYQEYEIVLINNNSTDRTAAECDRFHTNFPHIRFRYFTEHKQGLSHARNRGIQEAEGDMLVFIDDDAFTSPNYLSNLKKHLSQHADLNAFGGKIVPAFETGETPRWYSAISSSFVSALDKGRQVKKFNGKGYPIGANMGFYKKSLELTGVFETSLGRNKNNMLGGEEKDLFNRFKKKGLNIYYLPDVAVKHMIPPHRTTYRYIAQLGKGIGASELIRCQKGGAITLAKRYCSEIIKWAGTVILYLIYQLTGQKEKGTVLILFRKNVSKGLLGM